MTYRNRLHGEQNGTHGLSGADGDGATDQFRTSPHLPYAAPPSNVAVADRDTVVVDLGVPSDWRLRRLIPYLMVLLDATGHTRALRSGAGWLVICSENER